MTRLLLHGGRVFDPASGEARAADVLSEDGRILDVGPGLDGDHGVDVGGRVLLPGLIDCHVHVALSGFDLVKRLASPFALPYYESIATLATYLRLGITTVRDAGGAELGLKQAVDRGMIAGPRMKIAVAMMSMTGGHGDGYQPCGLDVPLLARSPGIPDPVADGADAVRRTVRALVRAGADQIKVAVSGGVLSPVSDPRLPHYSQAELEVLVEEATALARPVMAHAHSAAGIKNAVRAGVRSIEHGTLLDDQAIGLMLEHGTVLVPTLLAPQGVLDAAAAGVSLSDAVIAKARDVVDLHREAVARAVAAGVQVAMGTDCPVAPHGRNLDELALMAAAGMTPGQVWTATTLSAAQLLGMADQLGSLEPGKRCDVVALDGDLADLDGLDQRIAGVWKDGALVAGSTFA